jgi:N-acetylglucosamine-6-phosphate deacetylase
VDTTVISSRQVLLTDGKFHAARIEVAQGRIRSISPLGRDESATTDLILAPGFIDIQVNGIDDVDVWSTALTGDTIAWQRINNLLLDQGVTSWCPTLVTAPRDWYPKAIEFLRGQACDITRPNVIGVHLEGPFLGNAVGAHREQYVCEPDEAWVQEILDGVALMTLGAEVKGATEMCNLLRSRGSRSSIGHSHPTREEFENCVSAGATLVTHLFNAMSGVHHREPGLATWALTHDNVFASLIADGVHVNADVIELSFAAKPHKMVLVTDAVAWRAGSAGKIRVSLRDGAPRLEDGTLAGSAVTMPEAIKVCVEQAHVALPQVLQAASSNPATVMGLSDRGVLQSGYVADIVGLTKELEVGAVWVSGHRAR